MKNGTMKILDVITDRILAYGPAQKNIKKRAPKKNKKSASAKRGSGR